MTASPDWLRQVLGAGSLAEGATFEVGGQTFVVRSGIPRSLTLVSSAQAQTREMFGFKWNKRDAFESPASLRSTREWLIAKYGDVANASWLAEYGDCPLLLDAGCGAGVSALELFGPALARLRYLGIDVSEAVDVAYRRFEERGLSAGFLQADINALPFPRESVDVIFSEGALHHTDSTERAFSSLVALLKRNGRFLFYVYRRKGPIREFTDDYVRGELQSMSPEDAWRAMEPLTRLGIALGELDTVVDIPEPIDLLGIPAGRISVQRLFYWHVAKVFYDPELTFQETNHINFDWHAPANAHRHSLEEVRRWCAEAGLVIEREDVQAAGISVIARRA
jgi:arsenite methyltransferase